MSPYRHQGVTEQAKAAQKRLKDAKALFERSRWTGAMYVAGYFIECKLKARLMDRYGARTIQQLNDRLSRAAKGRVEVAIHDLEKLLALTNSMDRLKQDKDNWFAFNICRKWKTDWRYSPQDGDREQAEDFLKAVQVFGRFIEGSV